MSVAVEHPEDASAVRPFTVPAVPETELDALRARIAATRWPDQETVTDDSPGVPLAMPQELARYWAEDYDWRRCEAKLNALRWSAARRRAFDHGDGWGQPTAPVTSAVLGHASNGHPAGDLTRDDALDNITLYWLTNTAVSSARLYWETRSACITPPTCPSRLR